MEQEKLRKLVNDRYLERKFDKGLISEYDAPEIIDQVKVRSDQVNALIDIIAPLLPDE